MTHNGIIRTYAAGIGKGYLRLARSAGAILIALLVVAGISVVVVTPLWFFATRHTAVYTVVSICGLAGAALTSPVIRMLKEPSRLKSFLRRTSLVFIYLTLAGLLYIIVLLYAWGSFAIAVPLTLVHVAVTGLILYGKRSRKK